MIASIVFSRGKYKLIASTILNPDINKAEVFTYYDTHLFSLTNELLSLKEIKIVYLWEDQTLFCEDKNITIKRVNREIKYKEINNNLNDEDLIYKSESIWLLNEYKFTYTTKSLPGKVFLSENIEPKTIKEIYKLYFGKCLLLDDIILRYPLNNSEELKNRLEEIKFFQKEDLSKTLNMLKDMNFNNTKDPEEILSKIVKYIETINAIKDLNIKERTKKQEIINLFDLQVTGIPDFIDFKYPFIKLNLIPLWVELETIQQEIENTIEKEISKFQAVKTKNALKISKKIFDEEKTSIFFSNETNKPPLNINSFKDTVQIIKENKNSIIFTTQKFKEYQLRNQMICTQKKEIIRDFLSINLEYKNSNDFNLKTLLKIEKLKFLIQISKMSENLEIDNLKISKNLLIKSNNPIFSHLKLNIHILTGNNMSGKSTYLKYILTIIVLSQIGIIPFEVHTPLFQSIFLIKQEPHKIKNNFSSLESELLNISELFGYLKADPKDEENKLILVDEFGKSGSFKESTALASLFLKRLSKINNLHCFFITHDYALVKFCKQQIMHINFLKSNYFKITSGISNIESITERYLNIPIKNITNKEESDKKIETENQFALVLEEDI